TRGGPQPGDPDLTPARPPTINARFHKRFQRPINVPTRMSLQIGLLGRKIGMTQVFHDDGSALGCTAVSVGPCVVVAKRTAEKHGYSALQLGFEEAPVRLLSRPQTGDFKKAGVEKPLRVLREVRLEAKELDKYEVGKTLRASEIFKTGD